MTDRAEDYTNRIIINHRIRQGILLTILVGTIGFLAGCGNAMLPDRLNLNRSWHFRYDSTGTGLREQWFTPDTKISGWATVPGKSYWRDTYDGAGWFAQDVWLPAVRSNRQVALVVTNVADSATVWLNGSRLHMRRYNRDLEYADILPVYRPRNSNRLVIMVTDTGGPGGLSGDVYLRKYQSAADLGK